MKRILKFTILFFVFMVFIFIISSYLDLPILEPQFVDCAVQPLNLDCYRQKCMGPENISENGECICMPTESQLINDKKFASCVSELGQREQKQIYDIIEGCGFKGYNTCPTQYKIKYMTLIIIILLSIAMAYVLSRKIK